MQISATFLDFSFLNVKRKCCEEIYLVEKVIKIMTTITLKDYEKKKMNS